MNTKTTTQGTQQGTIPGTAPTSNLPVARRSLVEKFATKYTVEPEKLLPTLKATAFKQRDDTPISNEQMAALLIVADQYDLNPFTKQIYAFADRNGIVPIVGVDGWLAIINRHPQFNGLEFHFPPDEAWVTPAGGQSCPPWIECVIHRKDRDHPTVIREYLDESYRAPFKGKRRDGSEFEMSGPWQTHTKRMLRNKAIIQAGRTAFAFTGIYDEDEGERIIEARMAQSGVWEAPPPAAEPPKQSKTAAVKERLKGRGKPVQDVAPEPEPPAGGEDFVRDFNEAEAQAEAGSPTTEGEQQ